MMRSSSAMREHVSGWQRPGPRSSRPRRRCDGTSTREPRRRRVIRVNRARTVMGVLRLAARNRALRRLELAFGAVNGAEWGVWVALLVYGYGHGGATGSAAIALIQLLPAALLAPSLATLADRNRPGRVLLAGYLAQAASMALIAAAIALSAPVVLVFALAPLVNLSLTVPRPAQAALLPGLVSTPIELSAANVVSSWMENLSVLIAPA